MSEPGWYPPLEGAHWERPAQDYPAPEPPPPTKPRNWLVPAALAVGAAGIASAVTLAVVLWPRQATPPAAPTVAAPTSVQPPTPTTSEPPDIEMISDAVKSSMQKQLDSDPDLSGLKVTKVRLVHKSGNEYKGIATVRTPDGELHDVPVEVTADDDNTLWETPPGAFAFVHNKPPPPPPIAPPPVAPPPAATNEREDFTICPSGLSGVASDDTSCAFADSVRSAWYSNPGRTVMAYSPVTHQSYAMYCIPTATNVWPGAKRCLGTNAQGTILIVYIE